MKPNKLYYLLLIIFINMSSLAQNNLCRTKYPIIFVHGIGYKDNIFIKKYWGNIPKNIKKNGATVFVSNIDAFGTIENNSKQLQAEILQIIEQTGLEKVNIIAHSKGGIDSRYMISKLNMETYVASLTTISTPHRGSYWANVLMDWAVIKKVKKLGAFFSYIFAKMIFDKNPQPWQAYTQLRLESMEELNKTMPDAKQVYYQSYGGKVTENFPSRSIQHKYNVIKQYSGKNDGVVSVESYKWANFQGFVGEEINCGVSHFEIIGFSNKTNFDYIQFYINLCYRLKNKGF